MGTIWTPNGNRQSTAKPRRQATRPGVIGGAAHRGTRAAAQRQNLPKNIFHFFLPDTPFVTFL
jgi:hypothetical protein